MRREVERARGLLRPSRARPSPWRTLGPAHRWGALALVLLAGATLVVGLTVPVVTLRQGFSRDTYSVLTGIVDLAQGGNVLLALIVCSFSVVFPITKLSALLAVLFLGSTEEQRARALHRLTLLGRWSMLDVLVIAILVGSVQFGVLSEGRPQPELSVFTAAILLSMAATAVVERLTVPRPGAAARAAEEDAILARTRAGRWLSAAALPLHVAALAWPLMEVEKWMLWGSEYALLGATHDLLAQDAALAATVFVLVVALPLARAAGLLWIQWLAPSRSVVRAVALLDRWSMLDVFGLALLVVMVKIGDLAAVEVRPGSWFLLAAVLLSLHDSWRLQRSGSNRG